MLADFSGTAAQLISERDPPLYFGFKELSVLTEGQAEKFKQSFGRRASLLLDGVEHWQERQNGKSRSPGDGIGTSAQRIGLGVYLVQNLNPTSAAGARRKR